MPYTTKPYYKKNQNSGGAHFGAYTDTSQFSFDLFSFLFSAFDKFNDGWQDVHSRGCMFDPQMR